MTNKPKLLRFIAGAFAIFALSTIALAQANIAKFNSAQVSFHRLEHRQEIIFPKVGDYNVYTADLHTHTIYSDGCVTPGYRVREAWRDGLDIVAITDHIEYRKTERELYQFMDGYIKEEYRGLPKGVNTNIAKTKPDERGILVNLNIGYEMAKQEGDKFGIMVIRGAEITRGDNHFNVLFTEDNNKIYDIDTEQSIRNAIKQGAFVSHNHPTRDKNTATEMTPLAEELHAKKLFNGIEVGNSLWARDWLFSYCIDNGYAPISGTDMHGTTAEKFHQSGNESVYRDMNLILAEKRDEKSIKEALFAGRTIAYHNNKLIGKEEYLIELFKASVNISYSYDTNDATIVVLTNKSSFPYEIKYGKRTSVIHAMGAVQVPLPKGTEEIEFVLLNLFSGDKKHPTTKMVIERK